MDTYISPLRYPGGKGLLTKFAVSVLSASVPPTATYVEPFAGGAAIALGLLHRGVVERAVIGDADPGIAAFWKAATRRHDDLVAKIRECDVTLETWHAQREILNRGSSDDLELGFATFFMNRTNHSGVIDAGPIGGAAQTGKWLLDCRFNKQRLIERLEVVRDLADKITAHKGDGVRLASDNSDPSVFIYADPPYLGKSKGLYLDTMTYSQHEDLATVLQDSKAKWMVSYDADNRVPDDLYPESDVLQFQLRHSANRTHIGQEYMAFSPACAVDAASLGTLRNPTWLRQSDRSREGGI